MSAALPKPEPDPAPDQDAEGWALLESLRRRIDDQTTQGRKTQQQVTQLAESIGALVDVQRRRSRWLNLNSFVAYLIFTILCGAGFYFLYTSRAAELVATTDTARKERDAAVRRADDATTRLAARDKADTGAWEVYQLLEAGKRTDAMTKLHTIDSLPLSRTERAVLAARAHETQVMEVDAALKAAAAAFKAGRFADVIAPLEAALVSEPSGARSSAMHYYLGVAYAKSTQLDKAVNHLQIALAGEAEHEDVRFQLASALDRSGSWAKARAEYDRFATAHPQSAFAVFAMRRSATLARMPAQAPAAAVPAPAPAPMPATATPTTPPPAAAIATPPATPASPPVTPPANAAPTSAAPKPAALTTPPATPPANAAPKSAAPKPAAPKPMWRPKAPAKPAFTESNDSPPSPLPPPSPQPPSPQPSPVGQPMSTGKPAVDLQAHSMGGASDMPPNAGMMPTPTPWPARPSPPEREPPPEVTSPTPPPPPAPPPAERFDMPATTTPGTRIDLPAARIDLPAARIDPPAARIDLAAPSSSLAQ